MNNDTTVWVNWRLSPGEVVDTFVVSSSHEFETLQAAAERAGSIAVFPLSNGDPASYASAVEAVVDAGQKKCEGREGIRFDSGVAMVSADRALASGGMIVRLHAVSDSGDAGILMAQFAEALDSERLARRKPIR